MAKTVMELAFRELMAYERSKKLTKWPEGDVRRDITVVLWGIKEERKGQYEEKNIERGGYDGC